MKLGVRVVDRGGGRLPCGPEGCNGGGSGVEAPAAVVFVVSEVSGCHQLFFGNEAQVVGGGVCQ